MADLNTNIVINMYSVNVLGRIKRQIVRVDQNTGPNYRFSIRNPQTHIDGKQRDGERYTMLTLIERKWE